MGVQVLQPSGATTDYASAHATAGESLAGSANTVVNFDTVDSDPGGNVVTGAAWHYNCPVPGRYLVTAQVTLTSVPVNLRLTIYKNGTAVRQGSDSTSSGMDACQVTAVVTCVAGDKLDVRAWASSTVSLQTGNIFDNFIDIVRLGVEPAAPQVTSSTVVCTSTTRPAVVFTGLEIYETDTGFKQIWTGSGWLPFASTNPWSTYTPTITQGTGNGTATGRYLQMGKTLFYKVTYTFGTAKPSVALAFTAPPGFTSVNADRHSLGTVFCNSGGALMGGVVAIDNNATSLVPYAATSSSVTTLVQADATHPFTWATSALLILEGTVEVQ